MRGLGYYYGNMRAHAVAELMKCLSLLANRAGEAAEAAELYSRIVQFVWRRRMAMSGGVPWGALRDQCCRTTPLSIGGSCGGTATDTCVRPRP